MNKILGDHKQKGKIFQPPILGLGSFIHTSWIDFGIPEFVWIAAICDECGIEEGSRLFLEFTKISDPHLKNKINNGSAPALMSTYTLLNEDDKTAILLELQKQSILPRLRHVLTPFLTLYATCPLSFIKLSDEKYEQLPTFLIRYKKLLDKLEDKTSRESTLVMANVINLMNHLERFHVSSDINLPSLQEVLNYPDTESSQRIAGFLRSAISMCFNQEWSYDRTNDWIISFWNQSYQLEPIKL